MYLAIHKIAIEQMFLFLFCFFYMSCLYLLFRIL